MKPGPAGICRDVPNRGVLANTVLYSALLVVLVELGCTLEWRNSSCSFSPPLQAGMQRHTVAYRHKGKQLVHNITACNLLIAGLAFGLILMSGGAHTLRRMAGAQM